MVRRSMSNGDGALEEEDDIYEDVGEDGLPFSLIPLLAD